MQFFFNWISAAIATTAKAALETISTEVVKKHVRDRDRLTAKENLLDLYNGIVQLEQASLEFIELLDLFVHKDRVKDRVRRGNDRLDSDPLWYTRWANAMGSQAIVIANAMHTVETTVQQLNPQVDIYLPEIQRFLVLYQDYIVADFRVPAIIAKEYNLGELHRTPDGGIEPSMAAKDSRGLPSKELARFAVRLREAVDALGETKRGLANFIRTEFPFSIQT